MNQKEKATTFKDTPLQLNLSTAARERIKEMLTDEPAGSFLRIWIQGGGCSGMKYGFDLDHYESERELVYEEEGVRVLIDAISAAYLQNASIDFEEDFLNSKFFIENPNASTTCGCGESFSY